jgi:hypothetical protein
MQAALSKVQRRGAEQLRLTRKALTIVREVHAGSSSGSGASADGAEAEARSLRGQLEAALAAQRAQAETVRKYERRWQEVRGEGMLFGRFYAHLRGRTASISCTPAFTAQLRVFPTHRLWTPA